MPPPGRHATDVPAAAPPSPASPFLPSLRPSRREWLTIAVITFVGLVPRFWDAGDVPIEHYDEGVYASNLLTDGGFPDRHLYAPPLWPAVIEWTMTFLGPRAACWPTMLAGSLLVPVVWLIGRDWGSPAVGLIAAGLVAVDPFLVMYSRSALVDVPMTLFLATALWLGVRGVAQVSVPILIAAGICAGVAWSTKYSGWLPSAILITAVAVWVVSSRPRPRLRDVGLAFIIPAIAAAFWVVVLIDLQPHGGYTAVAANHRQYFGGVANWPSVALKQLDNYTGIPADNLLLVVLFPLCGATVIVRRLADWAGWTEPAIHIAVEVAIVFAAFGSAVLYLFDTLLLALLFGVAAILIDLVPSLLLAIMSTEVEPSKASLDEPRSPANVRPLGQWALIVWVLSLLVAIPLYTPYPRLIVPLLPALALLLAAGAASIRLPATQTRIRVWLAVGFIVFANTSIMLDVAKSPRTAARDIAEQVRKTLRSQPLNGKKGFLIYVLSEPSVFHHLAVAQNETRTPYLPQPAGSLVVLQDNPANANLQPLLLMGPQTDMTARDELVRDHDAIESYHVRPSRIVAANHGAWFRDYREPHAKYTLLRINPRPAARALTD